MESVSGKGSFEGVGMEIAIKGKILTVVAPLEGTPAYRAGIRAGDKILKIDDTLTDSLLLEEAVNLIRGEKGTEVVLTISRGTFDKPQEFAITRDVAAIYWGDRASAWDVNLYRTGANHLKTDDDFTADGDVTSNGLITAALGFRDGINPGVDGTFKDFDEKVVTVSGGIITNLDT